MFSYKDNEYLEYINKGKHITLTYRQVESLIKREANYLSTRLKDTKSKYVGLKLDNCPEWITAFWSILMAGYIPVLVNTRTDDNYNQILLYSLNVEYVISDHPVYEFYFINAYKAPYEEIKEIEEEH